MKNYLSIGLILLLTVHTVAHDAAFEQQRKENQPASQQASPSTERKPTPQTSSATPAGVAPRAVRVDLGEYGVSFQPDARLIVMMAALDAAGFDATPAGRKASSLRTQIKNLQVNLSENTRARLRAFYERNKLSAPATPAEQAARYVSLAFALGPAPELTAPERNDDLPAEVLEVLDFAPIVRDFYRESKIGDGMSDYLKQSRAAGDELLRPTELMVRTVLSYLHTRPVISTFERVPVQKPENGEKKKKEAAGQQKYTTRERERRFVVVPDLLAAPGAINLRAIGEEYYLIVPPTANMNSTEVRRAYLRYVIEPLVARNSREIAARRDVLRGLLDERQKARTGLLIADVFPAVTRSLVIAADVRIEETAALEILTQATARALRNAAEPTRPAITREAQARRQAIEDEATAQLADAYEDGAVLTFYFAEQLRGLETSGFDIGSAFADMIASFDPSREGTRPAEYKEARARIIAARQEREKLRESAIAKGEAGDDSSGAPALDPRLVSELGDVETMLRTRKYSDAETRLRAMMQEFPGEPRIFFALAQLYSFSARDDTFDEKPQTEKLNRALGFYRQTVQVTSPDVAPALLSRAHEAMGRILAFLDQPDEAMREFDAAIKLGDVPGGALREAETGKRGLSQAKP